MIAKVVLAPGGPAGTHWNWNRIVETPWLVGALTPANAIPRERPAKLARDMGPKPKRPRNSIPFVEVNAGVAKSKPTGDPSLRPAVLMTPAMVRLNRSEGSSSRNMVMRDTKSTGVFDGEVERSDAVLNDKARAREWRPETGAATHGERPSSNRLPCERLRSGDRLADAARGEVGGLKDRGDLFGGRRAQAGEPGQRGARGNLSVFTSAWMVLPRASTRPSVTHALAV